MTDTKAETGWSNRPAPHGDFYVAGFYWRRDKSTLAVKIIEIDQHGYIYLGHSPEHRFIIDYLTSGGYEFLGPLSPTDTEQLATLRVAAGEALEAVIRRFEKEYQELTDGQFGTVERLLRGSDRPHRINQERVRNENGPQP